MTKIATIQVFEDPGHGWARVPRIRLTKLGIADQISSYSYQRGSNVFLEEDRDLGIFVTALKSQGFTIKFRCSHSNKQSKIRNYPSYTYIKETA